VNVLGVSAFFHDSARCLMVDGDLVVAVEEERLSRPKRLLELLIDNNLGVTVVTLVDDAFFMPFR
jgi:predicted NodU family carbamoyl transferase